MSVRARLFLMLLGLSVVPILLLRVNGHFTMRELSEDLSQRAQHSRVAKTKDMMRMMVEDHAELWRREGLVLEQSLRLQAVYVQEALAGGGSLEEAYRASALVPGVALHGQLTVFENGRVEASGEDVRLPPRFDPRQAVWYRLAMTQDGPVWTAPVIDPVSRRIGLTLSMRLQDPDGRPLGVTALMAPFSLGNANPEHTKSISERLNTYLVEFASEQSPEKGLRIVGRSEPEPGGEHQPRMHGRGMGLRGVLEPGWLRPDTPADLAAILSDLGHGLAEVRQADTDGRDVIWAYAPVRMQSLALVMTAPKSDVAAEGESAARYIEGRFRQQMNATLIILLAALAVVSLAAWGFSRFFTRPISLLAGAARRLGAGDFQARVEPSGGAELAQLGRAFNAMAPELAERTRLSQAMALASEVHDRLLPATLPNIQGLELAAASLTCTEAGGDFFDVIPEAHGSPSRTALLVGDVSGHGLDAALLMATARAFLRMRALQAGSPAEAVTDVNRLLTRDTYGTGRFMTLFYLEYDHATRSMTWVRAGHDPAILYRAREDIFEELAGPGIPLGALEDRTFAQLEAPVPRPGDVLLLGSDGLWEARGPSGEMFGKERVRQALRAAAAQPAQEVLQALLKTLEDFRGHGAPEDDVTLLVMKTLPEEA